MADRIALARLGMTFGAVTVAVMLMTAFVVKSHVDARLSSEPTRMAIAGAPSAPVR